MLEDLCGQTALVTGGTRGIGAGISRALLAGGARVVATYHQDGDAAELFAQSCEQDFHGMLTLRGGVDVADPEAAPALFKQLDGPLQILVNNAGIRLDALAGMMSPDKWDRVLAVNLSGAFHLCKQAVRSMLRARYGRIINITSPVGRIGIPGQTNYAASKAGLVGLTRSLAKEVATRGITVNCVSPGFVMTDMIRDLPQKALDQIKRDVPMQRFGEVEEIAAGVVFLASKEASYISGAVLEVAGGL